MTRLLITASSLALLLPAATRAQQEVIELDTITIYGNQAELPLSRTGASVAVLEEDALQSAPSASVTDIVADTPGVTFTQPGGPAGLSYGGVNYPRVRGLDQKYAPVLFNGIDISDPSATQTSFDWKNLMLGGLSRAEVVRGSQSALYGSEAVAGVFALTGADAPEAPGTEGSVSLEAGAFDTRRASLSYGAATERAGFAIAASRVRTDGFSAFSSDAENDGFAGGQYSFDAYYDVTSDLRIGLTGFSFDSEFDYDPNPNTADTLQRGLRAYLEAQTGAVAHTFDVSRFHIDRETGGDFGATYEGERDEVSYLGTWESSPALTLSFGSDWTRETADSVTSKKIEVTGLFGEAQYAASDALDLSLSLRHDDNSQFGGFTTARTALTWRAAPDITVRSSLGNGFRAPSLNELYGPFGANPDLDPETSRSVDLGVEKTFASGAEVSATLFYTEVDDLIQYSGGQYVQVSGTSVSQGIELSGEMPLSGRVSLTGAYTYTDARDAEDDMLQGVARHAIDLGLAADVTDRVRVGASLQHRADLPETFPATGFSTEAVDDYTVANARVGYSFGEGREVYMRIENLFDADYEPVPGYETSDRAAYFGVRASF